MDPGDLINVLTMSEILCLQKYFVAVSVIE